jgi:hypothetical protein
LCGTRWAKRVVRNGFLTTLESDIVLNRLPSFVVTGVIEIFGKEMLEWQNA